MIWYYKFKELMKHEIEKYFIGLTEGVGSHVYLQYWVDLLNK